MHLLNPNLARQQPVERAAQIHRLPPLAAREADGLAERVDAGVGPTGGRCGRLPTHQALEHGFKLSLNRAVDRLPLPPCEATPVVLDHREKGAACHAGKDATRCHYLTRVIGLILHGLSPAPRPDRPREPAIALRGADRGGVRRGDERRRDARANRRAADGPTGERRDCRRTRRGRAGAAARDGASQCRASTPGGYVRHRRWLRIDVQHLHGGRIRRQRRRRSGSQAWQSLLHIALRLR